MGTWKIRGLIFIVSGIISILELDCTFYIETEINLHSSVFYRNGLCITSVDRYLFNKMTIQLIRVLLTTKMTFYLKQSLFHESKKITFLLKRKKDVRDVFFFCLIHFLLLFLSSYLFTYQSLFVDFFLCFSP